MQGKLLIIESGNYFGIHLIQRLSGVNKWHILFADNRFEAVTIVREKNIDVVLLSLKDFKREGLIILAEIKDICPPIEVITISSGDQITLSIEGMKLGVFDDFIVPFEFETLARRMQEALSEKYGKNRAP